MTTHETHEFEQLIIQTTEGPKEIDSQAYDLVVLVGAADDNGDGRVAVASPSGMDRARAILFLSRLLDEMKKLEANSPGHEVGDDS